MSLRCKATFGTLIGLAGLVSLAQGLSAQTPGDPAGLVVSVEDQARARAAIERLADPNYRTREAANRELIAMGRKAFRPLSEALAHPNAEIAERARLLFPTARQAEFAARIATFLADTNQEFEHDLPAWFLVRRIWGDHPDVRKLYVAMIQPSEALELMATLHTMSGLERSGLASLIGGIGYTGSEAPARREILAVLDRRRSQLQTQLRSLAFSQRSLANRYPGLVEVGPILLAETIAPVEVTQFNNQLYNTQNFFFSTVAREELSGQGEFGTALRGIYRAWLNSRVGTVAINSAMQQSFQQKFEPELTIALAHRLLNLPTNQPQNDANAIAMIGRLNSIESLPRVRLKLTDRRELMNLGGPPGQATQIQVRDFALLTMLYLMNEKPTDYGFTLTPNLAGASRFSYNAGSFRTIPGKTTADQLREQALEKLALREQALAGSVVGPAIIIGEQRLPGRPWAPPPPPPKP